jgi:two-component system, sensor histidine kinase and response regulator
VAGGHTPIVAMTAHALEGDRQRCLEAGMDAYVPKPLRSQELLETLERLVPPAVSSGLAPAVSTGLAPAANAAQPADWDLAEALARMDGDLDLLKMLAKLFQSECPQRMADIRQAITQRDASKLMQAAHTVKGSVGNFGAPAAVEAARCLEVDATEHDWRRAEEHWAALEKAVSSLTPVLDELSRAGAS